MLYVIHYIVTYVLEESPILKLEAVCPTMALVSPLPHCMGIPQKAMHIPLIYMLWSKKYLRFNIPNHAKK
jgi:hypothetical protein